MKIAWSKWFFTPQDQLSGNGCRYSTGIITISNPSEGITLTYNFYNETELNNLSDDPSRQLKDLCKKQVRIYLLNGELDKYVNKTIPIEDNLDYIENEAERRGLI